MTSWWPDGDGRAALWRVTLDRCVTVQTVSLRGPVRRHSVDSSLTRPPDVPRSHGLLRTRRSQLPPRHPAASRSIPPPRSSTRPSPGCRPPAPSRTARTACPTPTSRRCRRRSPALPPELVSRFVRKFGTTWGTTDDLRRVTPRVLTLAADHRLSISRSLIWQQLRAAQWTTWPSAEVDAIGRFLLAEFTRLLRVPPRPAHVAHRWLAQVSAGDRRHLRASSRSGTTPSARCRTPKVQRTAVGHLVELLTSSPLRPDLPATMVDVFPSNARGRRAAHHFLTGPGTDLDLRRGDARWPAPPRPAGPTSRWSASAASVRPRCGAAPRPDRRDLIAGGDLAVGLAARLPAVGADVHGQPQSAGGAVVRRVVLPQAAGALGGGLAAAGAERRGRLASSRPGSDDLASRRRSACAGRRASGGPRSGERPRVVR